MSLDVYLEGPHCDACGRGGERIYDANITHNLGGMAERAQIGDYAILYPDGFKSVSPRKAFEEGYTRKP